jgi:MFS family permease
MTNEEHRMRPEERRTAFGLAGIFVFRMLGLFMILPVLSLHIDTVDGATPLLIGIAIGAYGLTQAFFQIPLGMLSDRFGRKRIITFGLCLFAIGSVMAAVSTHIVGIIAGRAVQGMGAIAAAGMALAADLTRENQRLKVMAIIGASIGASFALALVLGPILNARFGLPGIFWLTAGLALLGIVMLHWKIPTPVVSRVHRDTEPVPALFGRVLKDKRLLCLDFGILALHLTITSGFVVLPLMLRDQIGLPASEHWRVYLPALLGSLVAVAPVVMMAERWQRSKLVLLSAIAVLGLALLLLSIPGGSVYSFGARLLLFFSAFNLLEALLPSLISKYSPADGRGTAMGVYSSSQFLGAFLGGALGGMLYGMFGAMSVLLSCCGLVLVWFIVALGLDQPHNLRSMVLTINTGLNHDNVAARLGKVRGVAEAVVVPEDGVAYLKVNAGLLDSDALYRVVRESISKPQRGTT